jgi:hypothetical protein
MTITYSFGAAEGLKSEKRFSLDVLPSEMVQGKRVAVSCPKRTIVTDEMGIGGGCGEVGGHMIEIDRSLEYREIGQVNYGSLGSEDNVWLIFEDLIAIPRDYGIESPQLYWVSWSTPGSRGLVITGALFIALAGVMVLQLAACLIEVALFIRAGG